MVLTYFCLLKFTTFIVAILVALFLYMIIFHGVLFSLFVCFIFRSHLFVADPRPSASCGVLFSAPRPTGKPLSQQWGGVKPCLQP